MQEIKRLMNQMQSSLIEMFNQLRELRRRLDLAEGSIPEDTDSRVIALFTRVADSTDEAKPTPAEEIDSTEVTISEPVEDQTDSASVSPQTEPEIPNSEKLSTESTETDTPSAELDSLPVTSTARVSRLLDPISHELNTGDTTADVIAEYLQAAKDDLISKETPNDRVARDMDIVLKFLRARGKRGIRSEERENILKRIKRWKAHLG